MSKEIVPIIPANALKYFLPNKPKTTKVAKGKSGINAIE